MSYELSFSPEFFLRDGEPYDSDRGVTDKPTSVWQAIESQRVLAPEKWLELAMHMGCKPEHLTPEHVLQEVQETNTCSCLSAPVEVWIDPEGWFRLWVYDE